MRLTSSAFNVPTFGKIKTEQPAKSPVKERFQRWFSKDENQWVVTSSAVLFPLWAILNFTPLLSSPATIPTSNPTAKTTRMVNPKGTYLLRTQTNPETGQREQQLFNLMGKAVNKPTPIAPAKQDGANGKEKKQLDTNA